MGSNPNSTSPASPASAPMAPASGQPAAKPKKKSKPKPKPKSNNSLWLPIATAVAALVLMLFSEHFWPDYLVALGNHWLVLMSGLASVILTAWEQHIKVPRNVFYVVAAMCIFAAGFMSWRDEYLKTHPGLRLSIDEYGVSEVIRGDNGESVMDKPGTPATVIATIRNLGSPSIADNWKLFVKAPGGEEIEARLVDFNTLNQQAMTIDGDKIPFGKLLYKQTLSPLASGDKKKGILVFFIEGHTKEEFARKGTRFRLTCQDVAGNLVAAIEEFRGVNKGHQHFYDME